MKTIDELVSELKLNPKQSQVLKIYVSDLIVELLESLRDENNNNFNETIDGLKNIS
jgi:hypothetical protein